jgi:hypothetical protein
LLYYDDCGGCLPTPKSYFHDPEVELIWQRLALDEGDGISTGFGIHLRFE